MRIIIAVVLILPLLLPVLASSETSSSVNGFSVVKVRQAYKSMTLNGYTRSKTTMTVSSEVAGRVIRVNYDVGQTIGKAPLYLVDPTFIKFEIARTQQGLDKLAIMQKKIQSNIAYLTKEFTRIDTLHKGDRATEVRRDEAAERLSQAKLELDALLVETTILKTGLEELNERHRRHSVYGPEGWMVVHRMVEQGEVVGAGTPLARIADFRELVVPLALSKAEYEAVKAFAGPFQAMLEGKPITAAIHKINPEFNEQTRKINLELLLSGYFGKKRGGLIFHLPINIAVEGLLIPRIAVATRYENPRVTLKATGETLNLIVLGEAGDDLIAAADDRLPIGAELRIVAP